MLRRAAARSRQAVRGGAVARRFAGKFVRDRWEERRVPVLPAPHKPEPARWSDERLTVAWLGHATVLLNFYGTWLLTDPALRPRVGVSAGVVVVVLW